MLWFKLKPWFEQNQCFCVQTIFYTKSCFTQKRVIHKHNVLYKKHVLAGPVQGLFAAYRIALSMVAGGTRRKRLNIQLSRNFRTWKCLLSRTRKHISRGFLTQHERSSLLNIFTRTFRFRSITNCNYIIVTFIGTDPQACLSFGPEAVWGTARTRG